jgi:hypothetical protein
VRCLYCDSPLAIMRMLVNGSFCCDEHKSLYEAERSMPQVGQPVSLGRPAPRRTRSVRHLAAEATGSLQAASQASPVLELSESKRPTEKTGYCGAVAIKRPAPLRMTTERNIAIPQASEPARPLLGVRAPRRIAARSDGTLPLARRVGQVPCVPLPSRVRPIVKGTPSVTPAARFCPLGPARPKPAAAQANPWPKTAGLVPLRLEPAPRTQTAPTGRAMGTPAAFTSNPLLPRLHVNPQTFAARVEPAQDRASTDPLTVDRESTGIDLSTQRLREIWRRAPGDLKVIAMVIPMILLLTLNAAGPRLYTKPIAIKLGSQPMFDGMLTRQWNAIRKRIAHRAGFDYSDDFKSGLDNWTVGDGAHAKWSYDNMGFVRPAGLGLYRPTLPLSNYHVEFIARIDEKGLGFAFRATDANNYQAVRLVMTKAGPSPEWHVIRYAVIGGHETARSEKPLPLALTPEKFFSVRLEAIGNDFTLMILDKMADFWSDDRLKTGGIGFFCGKGEQARVRYVDVSYQNDTLGRFCAFIASDNVANDDGS